MLLLNIWQYSVAKKTFWKFWPFNRQKARNPFQIMLFKDLAGSLTLTLSVPLPGDLSNQSWSRTHIQNGRTIGSNPVSSLRIGLSCCRGLSCSGLSGRGFPHSALGDAYETSWEGMQVWRREAGKEWQKSADQRFGSWERRLWNTANVLTVLRLIEPGCQARVQEASTGIWWLRPTNESLVPVWAF